MNALTAAASYQTPAFYADPHGAVGQSLRGLGGIAPSEPSLNTKTSLTSNVESLKAQQAALDLLHAVTGAAKSVFSQVTDVLKNADGQQAGTTAQSVDELLKGARFGNAPLFDAGLTHRTIAPTLSAQDGGNSLALFSPQVRGALQSAFENAFDIYA